MAEHVCPWWIGYLLASPLRRLFENPRRLLTGRVGPGMTVLDVGPGMGFLTLPAARLVGPEGRVVAVDLQERMLLTLGRRASGAGLQGRIETRLCERDSLCIDDLEGKVDFALTFHMVHEVPDQEGFFGQIARALAPGGRVLFQEPRWHVSASAFERSLDRARAAGLEVVERPAGNPTHSAILTLSEK